MEVLTEVALQPGANLKLAVSQTAEGTVRLAVVPPDAATTGQAGAPPASGPGAVSAPSTAPNVGATAQASLPRVSSASLVPASPEALAVSQAVQTSAPRQASLAPLFANLPVIVASKDVPQQVQSAATQLLATRPPLDTHTDRRRPAPGVPEVRPVSGSDARARRCTGCGHARPEGGAGRIQAGSHHLARTDWSCCTISIAGATSGGASGGSDIATALAGPERRRRRFRQPLPM